MRKFKFNYKLTAFLVGLFISFLLIFLGGKFEICRPFGVMCLGLSLLCYPYYHSDNVKKTMQKLEKRVDQIQGTDEPDFEENVEDLEDEKLKKERLEEEEFKEELQNLTQDEKEFMVLQLKYRQKYLTKNWKKIRALFIISGVVLIIAGIMLFA